MKQIKVLGSGCRNCEVTAKVISQAAAEAGVEIELDKVTDIGEIMGYGVMSTPGVVIDGVVVHSGGVPGPDLAREWVRGSTDGAS
ncbi:thioredoxin family protein [Halochromatium roseum]|uniref:thioredoxin family protein n=1 Tax=Halochromatium roseum TaxID=391920 RepID=UPI001913B348|nr:thioredoxin family protein [Halochromatium roseum]MBK5939242.1 thioredoxin family protein [Halochromatium roseum]